MAASAGVAQLYRDILKAAKRFPSIKRNQILEDIKTEFHANKVCIAMPASTTFAQAYICTCAISPLLAEHARQHDCKF